MVPSFDESFDVIVIGYGFAGAVAAINAADAGAHVLLAEKEPDPGGISICSYGAIRGAHSATDAFAYLKATNAGRTPDDVLRTLADGMATVESDVRALAAVNGAEIVLRENGGNYPFPGTGTFYDTNVVRIPGHDAARALYPNLVGSGNANGWRVFKVRRPRRTFGRGRSDARGGARMRRLRGEHRAQGTVLGEDARPLRRDDVEYR
jgi:glycine/D-amino acid oxidase-like deaminating enzyme